MSSQICGHREVCGFQDMDRGLPEMRHQGNILPAQNSAKCNLGLVLC